MGIPSGHALMHDLSCQLQYSKAYIEGNGLAFGEEIEQLWAKLRHLWPRVKYMRSENRFTVISSTFANITADMIANLPQTLAAQFKRANEVKAAAESSLDRYRSARPDLNLDDQALQRIFETRHVLFVDSASSDNHAYVFTRDVQLATLLIKKRFYDESARSSEDDAYQGAMRESKKCTKQIDMIIRKQPNLRDMVMDGVLFNAIKSRALHALAIEIKRGLHILIVQQQLNAMRRRSRAGTCTVHFF